MSTTNQRDSPEAFARAPGSATDRERRWRTVWVDTHRKRRETHPLPESMMRSGLDYLLKQGATDIYMVCVESPNGCKLNDALWPGCAS